MITIRKAGPGDADFIAKHAQRMLEFRLPAWRVHEKDAMLRADVGHITKALLRADADDCVFIAVDEEDKAYGFLRLVMQKDYYTGEDYAHVNDILVTADAEGKGIGKSLLLYAEEWAAGRNARRITLNVFEGNAHARKVYEKAGYNVEWIKYLKEL